MFESITALHDIRVLNLTNMQNWEQGNLVGLANELGKIKKVSLNLMSTIREKGVKHLLRTANSLTKLTLSNLSRVKNLDNIFSGEVYPNLSHLTLKGQDLSKMPLIFRQAYSPFPSLKGLSLKNCRRLSDELLNEMSACEWFQPETLKFEGKASFSLRSLTDLVKVKDESLQSLHLNIGGIKKLSGDKNTYTFNPDLSAFVGVMESLGYSYSVKEGPNSTIKLFFTKSISL